VGAASIGGGAGVAGAACIRGPSLRCGLPSVEDAAGAATQTRRCAPRTCVALIPPRRPPPRRSWSWRPPPRPRGLARARTGLPW